MKSDIEDVYFWSDKYGIPRGVDIGGIKSRPAFITDARPHRVHFYEIIFISEGQGSVAVNEQQIDITPMQLLVFRPYDVRSWKTQGLDGLCLAFEADFMPPKIYAGRNIDETAIFSVTSNKASYSIDSDLFGRLYSHLSDLSGDVDKADTLVDDVLRSGSIEIVLQLERAISKMHAQGNHGPAKHNPVFVKFAHAVEHGFKTNHRVGQYATKIGVSERHLNTIVRRSVGVSPNIYIRGRLVQEAKRLLRYSDSNLQEIAFELGFSDSAHFSKTFKRETGFAPSGYRKMASGDTL
jgi:AraC-like DNA-binding protein